MVKCPAEIFGYPIEKKSEHIEKIRNNHWCPFTDLRCNKQSRLINYPMGVCSVKYGDDVVALCPRRFLQKDIVFKKIADDYFKTRNNILVFSEVGLPKVGTFDFVMVKHRPFRNQIEDFILIEYQTGQTTGTGALVKALVDFMNEGKILKTDYAFGLNLADIWKRTFTQILNKGIILENWGNKIYWVIQEPVYQNFTDRYNIKNLSYQEDDKTVFLIFDLKYRKEKYHLVHTRIESSTIKNLFTAFSNNSNIPSKDYFISRLKNKIKRNLELNINLI